MPLSKQVINRNGLSWCDGGGPHLAALGSLGYRLLVHAALQVKSEMRYVRVAVP
jgi:hypothetical protein